MNIPQYRTGTGQLLSTHDRLRCVWKWCVIHSPMPGPWDGWPTHWRTDRRIMERMCPHGVGHPAAEEYMIHAEGALIHGCDGCECHPQFAKERAYGGGEVIEGEIVEPRKEIGW